MYPLYLFSECSNNESSHNPLYFNLSLLIYFDTLGMWWEDKVVSVLINKVPYQKDIWESGSAAPQFLKRDNLCR